MGHGFANNNPPYSYFQIVGNKGLLAVVELGYVYNPDGTTVQIWNAAGESLGSIVVSGRGTDPATNANWNQFVVTCDEDGVRLDVFDRDGVKKIDGALLSASIDQIKLLSHELCVSSKNEYSHNAGIDDVIVELPTSGETFTWTGAAGDGLWATAGNWLVDGNVVLSAPTELDAVVIPDGAMVVVSPDITYKTVTLGAGAKLCVLLGAIGETFAIPAGLEAGDIVAAGPFVMTAEAGVLTVSKRIPSTFVWSAGETGTWSMSSSWSVNGLPTLVAPIKDDTVRFKDDATVDFTANTEALSLEIAPGKTVTGNGNGNTLSGLRYFGTAEEKGGKLVLNKLNIESYSMDGTIEEPVTSCSWYGDL